MWKCTFFVFIFACTGGDGTLPDTIYDRLGEPLEKTGVLVIGAGGSGLAAGWAARDVGADVLIIEREAEPGGGSRYGSFLWGAGTSTQAAQGEEDSPEAALEDWAEFTDGGDPADPLVESFVYASADVIDWLIGLGMTYPTVASDEDCGDARRLHQQGGSTMPVELLSAELEDHIRLNTTATALVVAWGEVLGAEISEASTGETGWIQADAVIVATGGFGRNLDRVREAWPEVNTDEVYFECWPGMDGSGLDLVEDAGGALFMDEQLGGYVHSTPDPRDETGREVLVAMGVQNGIFVDRTGKRVLNEALFRSLRLADYQRELGQLWAIYGTSEWSIMTFQPPNYTSDMEGGEDRNSLSGPSMASLLGTSGYETGEDLADAIGVDGEALTETIDTFNEMALAGEDTQFGKEISELDYLDAPYFVVPLTLATAKSFGGARINAAAEVLSAGEQVIPGLYAAGEAAGMLGSASAGRGFSGALTAAYYTGLLAGTNAATRSLTND